MGRLLAESHRSGREDHQVSVFKLDLLVGLAHEVSGVFGARLTGASFGDCSVACLSRFQEYGIFALMGRGRAPLGPTV